MKIDGVKLQREIREKMHEEYKDLDLYEIMALVRQNLKDKGYSHLYENADESKQEGQTETEQSKLSQAK